MDGPAGLFHRTSNRDRRVAARLRQRDTGRHRRLRARQPHAQPGAARRILQRDRSEAEVLPRGQPRPGQDALDMGAREGRQSGPRRRQQVRLDRRDDDAVPLVPRRNAQKRPERQRHPRNHRPGEGNLPRLRERLRLPRHGAPRVRRRTLLPSADATPCSARRGSSPPRRAA